MSAEILAHVESSRFYLFFAILGILLLVSKWITKRKEAVAIIGVILLIYHRTIDFPYLNWDDFEFIRDNTLLYHPNWKTLSSIFVPGAIPGEMLYIPVTYSSYLLEGTLFCLTSSIVHTTNIILHSINSLLVLYIFGTFQKNRIAAFLGACLFAIHPLMVETVAWAMGRKDLLSCMFCLLALGGYGKFITCTVAKKQYFFYSFSLVMFLLGILAKPSFIVLPALLFLWDFWRKPARIIMSKIPYGIISASILWIHTLLPSSAPTEVPSLVSRMLQVPTILVTWLLRSIIIVPPRPFYCWLEHPFYVHAFSCLMVVILLYLFWRFWRKEETLLAGILFFLIGILPSLALVFHPREFITADRYGYFPLIGLCYIIGCLTARWVTPRNSYVIGIIIMIISYISFRQTTVWSSSVALWSKAIVHCSGSSLVYNNLGMALLDAGEEERAITIFKDGLQRNEKYPSLYNNLGRIYLDQSLDQPSNSAIKMLKQGLEHAPNNFLLHKNIGEAYLRSRDLHHAISHLRKAITIKSNESSSYLLLGNALSQINQKKSAMKVYQKALTLDPESDILYFHIGLLYEQQGVLDKAVHAYGKAIQLNASSIDARYHLASIYHTAGKIQKAKTEYLVMLQYDPKHVKAMIRIGNIFYQQQLYDQAEALYGRAEKQCRTNSLAIIYYNLGQIALARKQPDKGMRMLQKAIECHPYFLPAHTLLTKIYLQRGEIEFAHFHAEKAKLLEGTEQKYQQLLIHY